MIFARFVFVVSDDIMLAENKKEDAPTYCKMIFIMVYQQLWVDGEQSITARGGLLIRFTVIKAAYCLLLLVGEEGGRLWPVF